MKVEYIKVNMPNIEGDPIAATDLILDNGRENIGYVRLFDMPEVNRRLTQAQIAQLQEFAKQLEDGLNAHL